MSWAFLLAVFAALCFLAMVIAVMVIIFRAATRASDRPPGEARRDDSGNASIPPVIVDDSLTNPANPLYHLHHPTSMPDDSSRHHSIDPSPSPSFDSGSSASPSFDSGSSSVNSDSGGSGCG